MSQDVKSAILRSLLNLAPAAATAYVNRDNPNAQQLTNAQYQKSVNKDKLRRVDLAVREIASKGKMPTEQDLVSVAQKHNVPMKDLAISLNNMQQWRQAQQQEKLTGKRIDAMDAEARRQAEQAKFVRGVDPSAVTTDQIPNIKKQALTLGIKPSEINALVGSGTDYEVDGRKMSLFPGDINNMAAYNQAIGNVRNPNLPSAPQPIGGVSPEQPQPTSRMNVEPQDFNRMTQEQIQELVKGVAQARQGVPQGVLPNQNFNALQTNAPTDIALKPINYARGAAAPLTQAEELAIFKEKEKIKAANKAPKDNFYNNPLKLDKEIAKVARDFSALKAGGGSPYLQEMALADPTIARWLGSRDTKEAVIELERYYNGLKAIRENKSPESVARGREIVDRVTNFTNMASQLGNASPGALEKFNTLRKQAPNVNTEGAPNTIPKVVSDTNPKANQLKKITPSKTYRRDISGEIIAPEDVKAMKNYIAKTIPRRQPGETPEEFLKRVNN